MASTVTPISKRARSNNRQFGKDNQREVTEYDGLYLNAGVWVGDGDDSKFVRFPRGIALDDLTSRTIYENMDPDFAAEQTIINQRMEAIKERALTLEEGEYVTVHIPMVIYRRQEGVAVAPETKVDKQAINDELFGDA